MKMIVLKARQYLFSLILTIVLTLIVIIIGMQLQIGEAPKLKLDSENLLFWGLIAIFIQLGIGFFLLGQHKNLINDLKRISIIGDIEQPQAKRILKRMGTLGSEIGKLMSEQNDLSEMRFARISALNSLIFQLSEGFRSPILVTDTTGIIIGASKLAIEKIKPGNGLILNENLIDIIPGLNFSESINYFEKVKDQWRDPDIPGLVCKPIFDKLNKIQFCVWEFENSSAIKNIKEIEEIKIEKKIRLKRNRLKDLFGKLGRKK